MKKPICIVVLHDNSLTSDPPANRRRDLNQRTIGSVSLT